MANVEAKVTSPHPALQSSSVPFADVEREDDNVQTTILDENEDEKPAKTPQSTEEELPGITQLHDDDLLMDHSNLSAKPEEPAEEKHHDSDHVAANKDNGDDAASQKSLSLEERLLIEALCSDGDGPHQSDVDSPGSEASSSSHGGAASAYTPSYEEYVLLLDQLNAERAGAVERSKRLQRKLAPILAKKTKEELERVLQGPFHTESYERCLEVLTELKEKMREDTATAEWKIEELRVQAEEKLSQVDEQWKDLLSLKRSVAVAVLSRRVAKQDALARVEPALASEQMYQDELTRARLQNLSLENRILRLERALSDADRNATNPFQREYEKLHAKRMERKKYMEKQTEEALRVEKRVVRNLQILSDIKKTIHRIETEIQNKCQELAQVDAVMAQKRDTLACIKRARNSLQKDNVKLKKDCGLLGNEVLLRDYDRTTKANAIMEEKLKNLKYRRADLEFYLGRGTRRLETI